MSPKLIQFLPKSLISLQLSCAGSSDLWFDYKTGETIESVSTLPEFLIHENYGSNIDWKDDLALPTSLTEIKLWDFEELGDSFLLNQKFRNLIELDLRLAKHFTDLSIPYLHPRITDINLSASSNISGKSFQFLPRALAKLSLSSSKSIFDIEHLPRTLICVELNSAIHLTDLCAPKFPRYLEKLILSQNSQITPSSFPSFSSLGELILNKKLIRKPHYSK